MSVDSHFRVQPAPGQSGIDWFRAAASRSAEDPVTVHGYPRTVQSLALFVKAFPPGDGYAALTQPLGTIADVRGELVRLTDTAWPADLATLTLVVTASSEHTPWAELGLRHRKALRETAYLHLDLLRHRASIWYQATDLPPLRPEAARKYGAWWEALQLRNVDAVARRLGIDRPAEVGLPRDDEAGDGPILTRPHTSGTRYSLLPSACMGSLTLHVLCSPGAMADRGAAMWGTPGGPSEVAVHAAGRSASILCGGALWPTPSLITAPMPEPIDPHDVAPLEGYEGTLYFRTRIPIGPSGGRGSASIVWRGEAWGPPKLVVRGFLDGRKRTAIEKIIGATLHLETAA